MQGCPSVLWSSFWVCISPTVGIADIPAFSLHFSIYTNWELGVNWGSREAPWRKGVMEMVTGLIWHGYSQWAHFSAQDRLRGASAGFWGVHSGPRSASLSELDPAAALEGPSVCWEQWGRLCLFLMEHSGVTSHHSWTENVQKVRHETGETTMCVVSEDCQGTVGWFKGCVPAPLGLGADLYKA